MCAEVKKCRSTEMFMQLWVCERDNLWKIFLCVCVFLRCAACKQLKCVRFFNIFFFRFWQRKKLFFFIRLIRFFSFAAKCVSASNCITIFNSTFWQRMNKQTRIRKLPPPNTLKRVYMENCTKILDRSCKYHDFDF